MVALYLTGWAVRGARPCLGRFILFLITFLVWAELAPPILADSCASMVACNSCRNVTGCHWCPDQKCHAIGSRFGCIIGTYCYNNDQCQREEPEHRGYAAPPLAVILGVLLVGGTAVTCGLATIALTSEFAKQSATPAAIPAYVSLAGDAETGSASESEEDDFEGRRPKEGRLTQGQVLGQHRMRHASPHPTFAASTSVGGGAPSPFSRKVHSFAKIACGCSVVGVLLLCASVVTFSPHVPGVNVCNTQFDWGSIVSSLKHAGAEADFQILVSVYNPNVLDVLVESGTAVLNHKHNEIGTLVFEPILLQGGYVTDTLLTITIDVTKWDDLALALEYKTGTLAFLMDATVSASVLFQGMKTYPFTFSINHYSIKVSDTVDYDRSLCNCPQMMQVVPSMSRLHAHPVDALLPLPLADVVNAGDGMSGEADGRLHWGGEAQLLGRY